MTRRELIALLVGAQATPAFAQTSPGDAASLAAQARVAATQLQAYLDRVLKSGGRPDYSKPPASDLLGQVFNLKQLEALPPTQAGDLPWLIDWISAANGAYKLILFFGIAPLVSPSEPALKRNVNDYEDQGAVAINFMLRLLAREAQAAFAFMDQLPPAERTRVRQEGVTKMRAGYAETLLSSVGWMAAGMKPANARLISAAIRDTSAVSATAILPADRSPLLAMLERAKAATTDAETRNNLSSFGALLTEAK